MTPQVSHEINEGRDRDRQHQQAKGEEGEAEMQGRFRERPAPWGSAFRDPPGSIERHSTASIEAATGR